MENMITNERVSTTIINGLGNLSSYNDFYKCFLKDEECNILSHQYQCMIYLGNDHFAVCNVVADINYLSDGYSAYDKYYDILHSEYKISTPKLKWGIIRVNRDEKGAILPKQESMIIPYLYDRISENNLQTATAYHNDKLTYIDIDPNSETYTQQLVPCILEHACPFDVDIEGFAECSIDGIVGYLPRYVKEIETINGNELLTENQAILISKHFTSDNIVLNAKTEYAYFNLTGKALKQEQGPVLTKKRLPNNK